MVTVRWKMAPVKVMALCPLQRGREYIHVHVCSIMHTKAYMSVVMNSHQIQEIMHMQEILQPQITFTRISFHNFSNDNSRQVIGSRAWHIPVEDGLVSPREVPGESGSGERGGWAVEGVGRRLEVGGVSEVVREGEGNCRTEREWG